MKSLLHLFLLLILFITNAKGQINYVLNPSFEIHTGCPNANDQIKKATYWQPIDSIDLDPLCSPEYINACSGPNSPWGVPGTFISHYCHTGKGMAQNIVFYDESQFSSYHRDYLQGHLRDALTAGQEYCVTFYVFVGGAYGINHIGAYLDNGSIDTGTSPYCAWEQTEYIPQITELTIIKDTSTNLHGWHKIEGSFIAAGNERFITIGNFFDKAHTQYVLQINPQDTVGMAVSGGGWSWILVDDVSVIASNTLPHAGNDTTIYAGDSAFIGPHEIALPYWWYVQGHPSPIDSGGGIWVHPDSTTTYILQQTLCGFNTYDTVTITVLPDTTNAVGSIAYNNNALVYPNPANNAVTITNLLQGTEIRVLNWLGQTLLPEVRANSIKRQLDVSILPTGSYYIELNYSGQRVIKKLVITR
jgi:hypothetical protein